MNILVTGSAGFIGFFVTQALLKQGHTVIGIDNLNDYYDVSLKYGRLEFLNQFCTEHSYQNQYKFIEMDIADRETMKSLFMDNTFDRVIHLAAQAGVRYSIENPHAYVDSNLIGFVNVLEGCRQQQTAHLVYASSSSVYGMNSKIPFSTEDRVDYPISLYAATKKSNELMAHTYSHLYNIPTTGLRFFTVYGPWGRPDMAYYSFTQKIMKGETIDVFNHGQMERDFTYIDDIVEGILRVMDKIPKAQASEFSNAKAPYKIYNIGNNQPITLERFINAIENAVGKKAVRNNLPMQAGDVPRTYADVAELMEDIDFKPATEIEIGIKNFVEWYGLYENNKEEVLFHIITPSYNRPELLQRAVDSVLKQDNHNWNLHIVDDGSDQKTLAFLQRLEMTDSRLKIYYLPKNQGVNFVRNFALNRISEKFSEGFVTFLDDDDQLNDGCLTMIEEQIKQYPDYKWFIGNCIDLTGNVITKIKHYGRGNYIDDYMFSSKFRGDALHIISISAIAQNRFSTDFRNSEEWTWFLQIAKNTDYFSFNQDLKLVDYQVDGLSAKKVNQDKKLQVFLLKEQLCLDLKPAYLAQQRALLAREYFRVNDFKIGMQKLKQAFPQRWWNLKWYQILFYGLYKRLRA